MLHRLSTDETAKVLCMEKHMLKPLRECGFLSATKVGHGYVYDSEELEKFIRITRGFDLSNAEQIAIAAQIIQPQKNAAHR